VSLSAVIELPCRSTPTVIASTLNPTTYVRKTITSAGRF
jgi:hypothetical protein